MKLALVGALYLSISSLCAQTFTFPHSEKDCKASKVICTTLSEVIKYTPTDVTVSSIEFQENHIKIQGHSPGYKGIGLFIENLTMISTVKQRMTIASTRPAIDLAKNRIEHFQLEGNLSP